MKRAIGFTFLTLMALSLIQVLSPRLEAQNGPWNENNQPRDGVCFYKDANYRGENFCVSDNENLRSVGERYNDTISSIRIFGRTEVTVYENSNFNGSSQTFSRDMPNLGNWGDRITSFQIAGGRQYEGQYGGQSQGQYRGQSRGQYGGQSRGQYGSQGRGNERRDSVCFYKDANYRGENFCVSNNESLRSVGGRYNDMISSIRIFGGAEVTVYENSDFNGSRRIFSRDMPNLGNWSDRITSFQVAGGGQYDRPYERESGIRDRGRNSGREPRNGACFYNDPGYSSVSFCLSAGESQRKVETRFNDTISSVQVFGGARAVVHEHENFGGASKTLTGDVSNLAGIFNDKITSIQVR